LIELGSRKGASQRGSNGFSRLGRAAAARSSARGNAVLKRRLVVGVFVVLSLMLITIYFRESPAGGLHNLQSAGATILRPFQVGAERVARPFRDVYGYFSGLAGAKSENERLRTEVVELRQLLIQSETARQENVRLRELLRYRAPSVYPGDYRPLAAAVIGHPPTQFEQQIVISAGSSDGIAVNAPVVNGDGLIGRVTDVTPGTARVVLLTDQSSAVSALDIARDSGAAGVVQPARAGEESLLLNRVGKDERVSRGDRIVTRGSQDGELPSLYPRGIPIGVVTFVGQTDTDLYKSIQIKPYVDFGALDSVVVLVPREAVP
jgi:rod shape-determining protein MreC